LRVNVLVVMLGGGGCMAFERVAAGRFEVTYRDAADMGPEAQRDLLRKLEQDLAKGRATVLFQVQTLSVPHSVPQFWLEVTKRLAPGLCAMAIVSDNLAVRTAASGFSIANKMRGVKLVVKAFHQQELQGARTWCEQTRSAPPS
jgi:hypothetical protein